MCDGSALRTAFLQSIRLHVGRQTKMLFDELGNLLRQGIVCARLLIDGRRASHTRVKAPSLFSTRIVVARFAAFDYHLDLPVLLSL